MIWGSCQELFTTEFPIKDVRMGDKRESAGEVGHICLTGGEKGLQSGHDWCKPYLTRQCLEPNRVILLIYAAAKFCDHFAFKFICKKLKRG